ncbi:hypothetical protein LOTGIDRAFT_155972 [Lottia gigantea]|uniref:Novel STAND NTPase 3 domain-containing protein n=1 Tax=Lottia gigantea TaxID=225164 RepID=V4BB34_LOTGI|nr:hypothetical protein LOTGIDRAFT_155972 [Lottia gigantea]ESP04751.1 hypothetical protein LOTGIDRAFT_155972 [Lottia gigantea]
MDSTSGNGTGWANWGHNDPDSDSSVEEDGTEDSSDIFHSAKSNISSTKSASKETVGSEYETLWRNLEKTKISDSNDDDKRTGPPWELFERSDILTNIQHRASSQLPLWTDTATAVNLPSKTPEVNKIFAKPVESTEFDTMDMEKTIGIGPKNREGTAYRAKIQESIAPDTLESSFDFSLRQSRPSRPSSKPSSPREIIANRFKEQFGDLNTTVPEVAACDLILDPRNTQWITKDEENIDEQVKGVKVPTGGEDDLTDSLSIPSLGSSGKGQARYLEATKSKNRERITSVVNPTFLTQNSKTESRGHQCSNKQQLSNAEFKSINGLHKNADTGAFSLDSWESSVTDPPGAGPQKKSGGSKVIRSSDSWESSVKDTSGAAVQKKSGSSKCMREVPFSKDFGESPVRHSYGSLQTKSGNSNSASEVTKSLDISVPNHNRNNLKTVPREQLGSHKISSEHQEILDLVSSQELQGISDRSIQFDLQNHPALSSLTGDVPTRLSVYKDGDGYSSSVREALEMSKIPNAKTEQLQQEDRVEIYSIHSDNSYARSIDSRSSDAVNCVVPYDNGIMAIPKSQQTNVNIQKVTNFTHQQLITDDGTELLLRHTEDVMEDVKSYFDISETKAWQSVLNTDKIAFVVGFSEYFKKSIILKFYEKYRSRVDVFRLNGPEDWKICYKRSEPFAIFIEDAFGPLGTEFNSISHLIKDLSTLRNLEAALFTMNRLSFEQTKQSLKKCMKRELSDYVVHLEKEDILSEDDKRVILKKSFELVKVDGRSLKKTNNDGTICFENFIDDILGMAENPIFLDTCEEFVIYSRHDENVLQFFSLPLDCLVDDFKYLKEKWPDGYNMLRLVAFHELTKYLSKNIDGNLLQILDQLVGSYLKIQNKVSALKFAFQHRMMQYAVLCTETDKAFLINHCPIGFLVDVVAKMTNMRKTSFENENCSIVKRFIQEIVKGKHVATVVIHEIWDSKEFMEDFKQKLKTELFSTNHQNCWSGF